MPIIERSILPSKLLRVSWQAVSRHRRRSRRYIMSYYRHRIAYFTLARARMAAVYLLTDISALLTRILAIATNKIPIPRWSPGKEGTFKVDHRKIINSARFRVISTRLKFQLDSSMLSVQSNTISSYLWIYEHRDCFESYVLIESEWFFWSERKTACN